MVTIAPRRAGLGVRTRQIGDPGRLLDLLPDDRPLVWLRGADGGGAGGGVEESGDEGGGDGLVAWGEVARFPISGPGRFAEADRWWQRFAAQLAVDDPLGLPGTGPVAFATFTFADGSAGSMLIVPRVVVGRRAGVSWITEFSRGAGPSLVRSVKPVRRPGPLRYTDGDLPVDRYRAAVAEAVRRMRSGRLAKVALAHDLLAVSGADIDARFVLARLSRRYPTCWTYAIDGLVGATPELLLRRRDGIVESRVLAGSIWPGEAPPDELAGRLLGSGKDRREHALAVDSLADALRPFCTDLDVPAVPSVLTLRNVTHLASDVEGKLPVDEPATLLAMAAAVHPTAAVGGTPRATAVATIAELEGMDRGRYAGPVGWIDAGGDGELGIALRCAQLDGPVARLIAGCGIVSDSDPDTEVREAAAKLVAVRDALEDGT